MRINNILRNFVLILFLSGIFPSCVQDDMFGPEIPANSSSSILSFISDPMERYKVTTRASYTKDDEEKKINNIHVFFFDETGEYLKGGYLTGYPSAPDDGGYYALGEGVTSLKIDDENFSDTDKAKNAIIYAVANVDQLMFSDVDENGLPKNVTKLSDLENMDFSLGKNISLGIPNNGLPMVSKVQMDLTSTSSTKEHIVELKSLMSRIDVNISLESDITDHNYPAMTLVDWTAKNIPVKGSFSELASGAQTGDKWGDETWTKDINTSSQKTIYNKNGEIALSFYMFENVQSAEWKKNKGEDWQKEPDPKDPGSLYPAEIIKNDKLAYQKQRYKPYLANKNAAAVQLHAFYSTYNESGSGTATYDVYYTLYLGANHTDDFKVKRNHKYENNITIKGLTQVGTNPDHITFDARVNVKDQDNEFYIAMLRERNHDAHFCVTPMDVYLFEDVNKKPTMEVILGEVPAGREEPTNVPDWIRMEKVCAADMEAGTVTQSGFKEYVKGSSSTGTHLATHQPWHAGNGKRAFFTKDLLTNTLNSGKSVTINNTRDRVYFYIDENLQLQDRSAIVTLIYKENGTEVKRRTIEIGQTHFLPVTIDEKYVYEVFGAKEVKPDYLKDYNRTVTIYMERYEEYLDHYDPLDEHQTEQIYAGLPWGLDGINIGQQNIYLFSGPLGVINYYSNLECSHNWYLGLAYTNEMIRVSGQGVMNLNEKPRSAAEYCYNKNKRESDGTVSVSNKKYFLPGIRQMEKALKAYYTTFPEFQESYYWSSAVGEEWNGSSGQNKERARATKIKPDGNYYNSGGGDGNGGYTYAYEKGNGGYAKRTESLRIRAFRNDLK